MKTHSYIKYMSLFFVYVLYATLTSCSNNIFDKQPLDQVTDATFWKSESDAKIALTGCYFTDNGKFAFNNFWSPRALIHLDLMAGNGSEKDGTPDHVTDGTLFSGNTVITGHWNNSYNKIARCNNFLRHSNDFNMNDSLKRMYIAEVRVIRAYEYFNLALYFGGVPLVTTPLTINEANSVTRNSREEVWNFCEQELKESLINLPTTRTDNELGRITSGAALAILGRLQMAEKKWSEATTTYKAIIEQKVYSIAPNYNLIFTEAGEKNNETIMRSNYVQNDFYHALFQQLYPETWGGWHQFSPYNELVKDYECIDGMSIEESPLYNEDLPYENRDPRLLYTILVNGYSSFQGKLYISTPGSTSLDRLGKYPQWSGYCIRKYMDETSTNAQLKNSGVDIPLIRYAEVLLGYIESKLESGVAITQNDLDISINLVRGRADVNMPKITETNKDKLRDIVRRERHIELAFEGIRYYDILRWGIAKQELNRQFTGMKLTTDPAHYTDFKVDSKGYYLCQKRDFKDYNVLWPIPLNEIQLNKNLEQNPGY